MNAATSELFTIFYGNHSEFEYKKLHCTNKLLLKIIFLQNIFLLQAFINVCPDVCLFVSVQ